PRGERTMKTFRLGLLPLLAMACQQPPAGVTGDTPLLAPRVITAGSDALRTAWYPDQPTLGPVTVGSAAFGRRFNVTLPLHAKEQVFAQPLVLDGKVLLASESNDVYVLDGET